MPVAVFGTTSDPDKCPSGVLGCFKHEVAFNAPNEAERRAMLEITLKDSILGPDVDLKNLATQTAALVAADLVNLASRSKLMSVSRVRKALSASAAAISDRDLFLAGLAITGADLIKRSTRRARVTQSRSVLPKFRTSHGTMLVVWLRSSLTFSIPFSYPWSTLSCSVTVSRSGPVSCCTVLLVRVKRCWQKRLPHHARSTFFRSKDPSCLTCTLVNRKPTCAVFSNEPGMPNHASSSSTNSIPSPQSEVTKVTVVVSWTVSYHNFSLNSMVWQDPLKALTSLSLAPPIDLTYSTLPCSDLDDSTECSTSRYPKPTLHSSTFYKP